MVWPAAQRLALVLLASLAASCTGVLTHPDGDGQGADGGGGGGGTSLGFGYPVGDQSTYPAGGWRVWQVLGHYWASWGGRHLAQDISHPEGGAAGVDAPVYAVADGIVRYAGPNSSSYANVVLIEHPLGDGTSVCSFYGHVNPPLVATGDEVERGQQITSVLDWAKTGLGASSNTHLHYVLLNQGLCEASAAASGTLICGYDDGGASSVEGIDTEPSAYQAIASVPGGCPTAAKLPSYGEAFISPTHFIEAHHHAR